MLPLLVVGVIGVVEAAAVPADVAIVVVFVAAAVARSIGSHGQACLCHFDEKAALHILRNMCPCHPPPWLCCPSGRKSNLGCA